MFPSVAIGEFVTLALMVTLPEIVLGSNTAVTLPASFEFLNATVVSLGTDLVAPPGVSQGSEVRQHTVQRPDGLCARHVTAAAAA